MTRWSNYQMFVTMLRLLAGVVRNVPWYKQGSPARGKTPRDHYRYQITPNSHPSKVSRWMRAGGGIMLPPADLAVAVARHRRGLRGNETPRPEQLAPRHA